MSFLNPLLLWGLVGAGLPVLVHLLGRRRGRRVEFAAMEFLLASEKKLAARRRIRDLLLLAVRSALVALVALALARPLLEGARAAGAGMPVSAVLVLDRSASMAATSGGEAAFERARRLLGETLAELPSGSEALLVTLEREPQRLTPGFVSPADAARALREVAPGTTSGRAAPALALAASLLPGARRARHLVVVASDLQALAWDDESLAGLGIGDAELRVRDAAPDGYLANVTLVAAGRGVEPGAGVELEARRSAGDSAGPAEVLVRVEGEGRVLNRGILRFAPDGRARTSLALPEAAPAGVEISATIESGDSLAFDDRRFLWLESAAPIRVRLGNGAPNDDLYRDELFYLERALQSEPGRFSLRVEDASQGQLGALDDCDVVVLANVERLGGEEVTALREFVAAGGGLLVAGGDRSTPEGLERTLGALLPARPRALVAARPGEPPIGLLPPPTPPHVVVLPFDERSSIEVLEGSRFERLLALEPTREAEVVLVFSSGMPALVVGREGRGRTAIYASTLDRDWSTLAVRPPYVPLVNRLVAWLGGRLERARPHLFLAGDRVPLEPGPGEKLEFDDPQGRRVRPVEVGPGREGLESVTALGPWRALRAGRREPELDFAVNLDPAEGDLARVDPGRLGTWLGEEAIDGASGAAGVRSEARTALPLLFGVALAFAAEILLGRRAARRPTPESEAG